MNRFFYGRLAAVNIRTNRRVYIPFLLTCILMTAMHYIIGTMAQNEGFRQLPGGDSIASMLEAGVFVTAIFAVIFLFYTNSFLMKRRTKEFGLYNILGMEKSMLPGLWGLKRFGLPWSVFRREFLRACCLAGCCFCCCSRWRAAMS